MAFGSTKHLIVSDFPESYIVRRKRSGIRYFREVSDGQKAVAVLLTVLFLVVKGIRLGSTLPAFVSPVVLKVLVEKFEIKPIGEVAADVEAMILNDLISVLNFDASVQDIRQGVFHTGVLTRYCGLAATLPREALRQEAPMAKEPGLLLDKTPRELAQLAYSQSILEAAIGMAAINSLLEVDEASCLELNAADLIMEKGQGKRIAIVGHFPFIPDVRKYSKKLWVIEKNSKKGDFEEDEADQLIPQAEVVAITGTALTNHTMEHLLGLCNPKAFVIALGATVPLSPILFDHGLNAISGTRIRNAELALRCVSEGANFRQIRGVMRLTLIA